MRKVIGTVETVYRVNILPCSITVWLALALIVHLDVGQNPNLTYVACLMCVRTPFRFIYDFVFASRFMGLMVEFEI